MEFLISKEDENPRLRVGIHIGRAVSHVDQALAVALRLHEDENFGPFLSAFKVISLQLHLLQRELPFSDPSTRKAADDAIRILCD